MISIYDFKKFRLFLLSALFLISAVVSSQNLTFKGYTKVEDKPLQNVTIKVKVGPKVIDEFFSDEKGFFSTSLPFNFNYTIYFEKAGFCIMHADIKGAVPDEKSEYKIKYEITIPFYTVRNQSINEKVFEQPFSKIAFDGKTKFVDDLVYVKQFVESLKTFPNQTAEVKQIKAKEVKSRIAGKVLHNDELKSPYKLVKVTLLDTNNKEIKSTFTNKFGTFSFGNIGALSTAKIIINKNGDPDISTAVIYNLSKELVSTPEKWIKNKIEYNNTVENKLVERLITDKYIPFIAGKLTQEINGESVLLSNKNIYLFSDKNELIETVKSNLFGNFLFSKLSPDKNFAIGIDEADGGLATKNKIHLYSSKDVEIAKKDSLLNGKFLFNFIANDIHTFHELLVEDSDIKMNVKGKMVGDNENNPLKNIRIVVLDKKRKVLDTITTSNDGKFKFNYLPYSDGLIMRIIDTNDLSNFRNIIFYDEAGNVVKYFLVKNGELFEYKLLSSDLELITELYVDDPWLNLADKNLKKPSVSKMVIIENIYFEFNKADLLSSAKQILDKAIVSMKANASMKIEISAHSDSKGADDYNLKLSQKRALSALNYIVSKEIAANRVTSKGFGETKLLNKCGNKVVCTEEEHAKNRRLEFNISLK